MDINPTGTDKKFRAIAGKIQLNGPQNVVRSVSHINKHIARVILQTDRQTDRQTARNKEVLR